MRPLSICITICCALSASAQLRAQDLWTIQVSDLKASSRNGNISLSWKVTGEENMLQYEVESSTDGKVFRNIGFIPAVNRPAGQYYSFDDKDTRYNEKIFYRLKAVNRANHFTYTEPVVVLTNKLTAQFVYPSVVTTGMINIFVEDPFRMVQVVSMNGTVILQENLGGKTGRMNIPLPSNISPGMYIVQLRNNDQLITQKIIVQ